MDISRTQLLLSSWDITKDARLASQSYFAWNKTVTCYVFHKEVTIYVQKKRFSEEKKFKTYVFLILKFQLKNINTHTHTPPGENHKNITLKTTSSTSSPTSLSNLFPKLEIHSAGDLHTHFPA